MSENDGRKGFFEVSEKDEGKCDPAVLDKCSERFWSAAQELNFAANSKTLAYFLEMAWMELKDYRLTISPFGGSSDRVH